MGTYNGNNQLLAAAAITQYQVCKLASGKATPVTAANEQVYGVAAYSQPTVDKPVSLQTEGQCDALVNGSGTAIAAGDDLMPATGGRFVKYVATAGNVRAAKALAPASDIRAIRVQLYNPQIVTPS
jgi:hypothetical protein